ncbi:prolyl oligopeptidase family serine peptidase [Paraglaciecola aquimarina]|uniref:Prolyl oligopeptidase family serine peptidase n=1 Tax=Paraglaciecola aquimarina TaxID=1235557 RepID=A0ABU3SUK1_9ALTE|nr:prolyl oligopeptidase family serine peptidase [Paraglaciecola aquimarina]MDU0353663.1 prolyl oligopeptidase family serine peptidase [Paraglaciecola aquimarina]
MHSFDEMFNETDFNLYKSNLFCSTFKYKVDNEIVYGYAIKPKAAGKKLPVLIYNRGGNGNFGMIKFPMMMFNLFPIANEGFVIIGSQYRGTGVKNTKVHDEFGGQDVQDVVVLTDLISGIDGVDSERLGIFGSSRGGMQTHLAVKQLKKVKAIATLAGNTDLLAGLEYRPFMEKIYLKRIPNYKENKEQELAKRSVIKWVDKLSKEVPILLLHGTHDKKVSVNHSKKFAESLSKNGIPHKLVLYSGENHSFSNNIHNVNEELIKWFSLYL